MPKPKQSEKDITRAIRSLLNTLGIWHWKQWQGMGSYPGVADILGIYQGKLLAIEVKTVNGKVSDRQDAFIDQVNLRGGIGFVARSPDDVIEKLGLQDRFLFNQRKQPFTGMIGE